MKKIALLAMVAGVGFSLFGDVGTTPRWLRYPSISPDGKTIVFCYQGDIYSVASSGGLATPLTLGQSYNTRPVWSPDGNTLAFASDRYGSFDVFVMPASGGMAKRLTFHSASNVPSAFTHDGQQVLFTSNRISTASDLQFPSQSPHTYTVPVVGGQASMMHTATMEYAVCDPSGTRILFQNLKGYEDQWRKHHTSSVTRDICLFDINTGSFKTLTPEGSEYRNPVFGSGDNFYFLAERGGTFNVYKSNINSPQNTSQLTRFDKHPVRFLSRANDNTLCFAFDGDVYTMRENANPSKININIHIDNRPEVERVLPVNGGLTEFTVATSGKEVAFVVRGELFASNADGTTTKRLTDTPTQERSVSFSPDGRTLFFAAERNKKWELYSLTLTRKEENYFYASTVLKETCILSAEKDVFQPLVSPDGKEVAYLENRTSIKVLNLASGKTRTILPEGKNYSYSDGDQFFAWSPDSKWLTFAIGTMNEDVALVNADGNSPIINLTKSGFSNGIPKFSADGSIIYWATDRESGRGLSNNSIADDVVAIFLTQDAWDKYTLNKDDFALFKEIEEKEKKEKDGTSAIKDGETKPSVEPMRIDWEGIENRKARLTVHTASMADFRLSKDADKLFYLARFEQGLDLWSTDLRTRETKLIVKLGANNARMELSSDGKTIFLIADGRLSKINVDSGKRDQLPINTEMVVRPSEERAYIFDHAWRQIGLKFYVADLHGVDWNFYHGEYKKFLPYINNNYDFAELLSEMLGELNASHTGGRYRHSAPNGDVTASLGLFFDTVPSDGLKIAEVINKGPLDKAISKVKTGHILVAIDGVEIKRNQDYNALLNRKAGKLTLLTFVNPTTKERWDESIKPISLGQESALLYDRWVERQRLETKRLSNGRLGYVHVRGMNDSSMRVVVEEALGRYIDAEALIVDTRFNGGGNLHEALSDFLSGKKYFDIIPRGQYYGHQPGSKWIKPSIVIMNEGNYSDAHLFPVAYKIKELGKTVGMPVAGTGTFVWWETQIDPTLVFGIPQGGWRTPDGLFCENNQLEPDIKIANEPAALSKGVDMQLEAAVRALLDSLKK
ncbi:MAG: S41 family peptidase [Holophagaceae bacterium]|nr:S41 family peptidase [Holophagaceae bacterium]